jgi:hypothetical protein
MCLEAEAAAGRLEVLEHRRHQAHSAGAERVAKRDGASVAQIGSDFVWSSTAMCASRARFMPVVHVPID